MDSLTFIIVHHSTSTFHTQILYNCINAIRRFHNNRIVVCHTSTSPIPDKMNDYRDVEFINSPLDGTHIYGALYLIVNDMKITNYMLLHDSMILLRKLPESVIGKRFYFLWHFDILPHDHKDEIVRYIGSTNLPDLNKFSVFEWYFNGFPDRWRGLFGPAFGGTKDALLILWKVLNINLDNISTYKGRMNIMAAERYLPLMANYLGLVDTFENTYSLNGSISNHPHVFTPCSTIEEAQSLVNDNYGSYMWKLWIGRP